MGPGFVAETHFMPKWLSNSAASLLPPYADSCAAWAAVTEAGMSYSALTARARGSAAAQ